MSSLSATNRGLPAIPRLEAWLGPWAMEANAIRALSQQVEQLLASDAAWSAHLAAIQDGLRMEALKAAPYEVSRGVAIVPIHGPMMKHRASLGGGASTVHARRQIRAAVADDVANGLLLHFHSPGGTFEGTDDLAQDVAWAASRKPTVAYAEDCCCSAAYYAASQAIKVFAGRSAVVGSIGTYGVLYDTSAVANERKVKVHVVRAGAFKGMGEAGTEITAEQLAEMQRFVNGCNDLFLSAVATGRGMSRAKVEALATGQVWIGAEAVEQKLVDGIGTLEQAIAWVAQKAKQGKGLRMSGIVLDEEKTGAIQASAGTLLTAPGPATFAQLKGELIGADSEFLCRMLDGGRTLDEARQCWMGEQSKRLELAQKNAAEATAKAASAVVQKKPGTAPLAESGNLPAEQAGGDVLSQFDAAVQAAMPSCGNDRFRAVAHVANSKPALHRAFLLANNPKGKAQRLLQEKFE